MGARPELTPIGAAASASTSTSTSPAAPARALRALVSVRDLTEARLVARAGVGFVDLKEPNDGALGGLALATIGAIVTALRAEAPGVPISATIGDWPADALETIEARVRAVAACGVDHVKVGIAPRGASDPAALRLVDALGAWWREGLPLVPVLIVDGGVDAGVDAHGDARVDRPLLQCLCAQRFAAVMLDTVDKRGGSLLQRLPPARLAEVIATVQGVGSLIGLAGALQLADLPALLALGPDFAGFRSAVCAGDRRLGLDGARLQALLGHLRTGAAMAQPVA